MTTPKSAYHGYRDLLRQRLSEILDAFPEHNTTAEHDVLLDHVMDALGDILEGIEEVTTPK